MIEILRMFRDALNDSTTGVNAKLLIAPLDGTDTRPAPVNGVWIQADRNVFVRDKDLASGSIITVEISLPAHTTVTGQVIPGGRRDWAMEVCVGYVTRNADDAANYRNTEYTLRAAIKAISVGLTSATQRVIRGDRNGIAIKSCTDIVLGETKQEAWGAIMTGALTYKLTVVDKSPT